MTILLVVLSVLFGVSLALNWHMLLECRFYEQQVRSTESQFGVASGLRDKWPGLSTPIDPAVFQVPLATKQ